MNIARQQTDMAKGVSILMIFLCNFTRRYLNGLSSNEMYFDYANVSSFTDNVVSPCCLVYVLGYLGWVGVPVFIFLSGYGLSKKYDCKEIGFLGFIGNHLFKLWKLLLPVYLIYVATDTLLFDDDISILAIVGQITFLSNVTDFLALNPRTYWFFGAIFQFYILYFIIRRLNIKYLFGIVLIGLVINYLRIYYTDIVMSSTIRYNCIGWLAPFALGIIFARKESEMPALSLQNNVICLVVAVCCVVATSLFKPLTPLTDLFVIIAMLSFVQLRDFKSLTFLGVISSSIFVVHPFVRMVMYNIPKCDYHAVLMTLLYIPIVISLSYVHSLCIRKITWKGGE